MTFEVILHLMRKFRLHNVDNLYKVFFFKYSTEEDDCEISKRPYINFNDLLGHTLFYEKFAFL